MGLIIGVMMVSIIQIHGVVPEIRPSTKAEQMFHMEELQQHQDRCSGPELLSQQQPNVLQGAESIRMRVGDVYEGFTRQSHKNNAKIMPPSGQMWYVPTEWL